MGARAAWVFWGCEVSGTFHFELFRGGRVRKPSPAKMDVGEIVTRKYSRQRVYQLRVQMRKAMKAEGMEFSEARDGDMYAIRRDK